MKSKKHAMGEKPVRYEVRVYSSTGKLKKIIPPVYIQEVLDTPIESINHVPYYYEEAEIRRQLSKP